MSYKKVKKVQKIIINKLSKIFNKLFINVFKVFPVRDNFIVLESEGDFCDNPRAFYEYLLANGFNSDFKIIWLVKNPEDYKNPINVSFVSRHNLFNFRACYYIAVSKLFLFSHPYWLKKWRKKQTVVNMTHSSMMLKSGGDLSLLSDYMLVTSELAKKRKIMATGISNEQALKLGAPRLDLLYKNYNSIKKIIPNYDNEDIVLSMSTFKISKNRSDSSLKDEFALNVVKTEKQMKQLNLFLRDYNKYMIVKIHHLQDLSKIKIKQYDRIFYLKDENLLKKNIQLYELVKQCNILLTDYSSIFYDFLLLNGPIAFMINDMEEYTRGFCIDNPFEEMVGPLIETFEELLIFLKEHDYYYDLYKNRADRLKEKVHEFDNNENSKRLLSWLLDNQLLKKKSKN